MSFNIPSPSIADVFRNHHPFYVPKYQRGYAWNTEEVADFINDIKQLQDKTGSPEPHFMGGIVHVNIPAANVVSRKHEVVDGQQRMATVSLAMAAILEGLTFLSDKSKSDSLKGRCSAFSEEIRETFLVYKETQGATRVDVPKLTLSKKDEPFFRSIIDGTTSNPSRESHKLLRSAFDELYKELIAPIIEGKGTLTKKLSALTDLYRTISEKCVVIHIVSRNRTEAYRLFSVLNDRGRNLTDGDLLRARTLELLENNQKIQDEIEKLWDEILDWSPENVVKFLKAYFPSVTGRRAASKSLFDSYQNEFLPSSISATGVKKTKEFVKALDINKPAFDLIRQGEWPFVGGSVSKAWDRDRLHRLVVVMRHELAHPLLLSACTLGEKKFIQVVRLLERFVFRYITVVGAHPSPLYGPYNSQAKAMRDSGGSYNVNTKLKSELSKLLIQRAPDDAFRANLIAKFEYSDNNQRNREIRHFLSTLESYRRWVERGAKKTPTPDTMTVFDVAATTIEHIYPATADKKVASMEKLKNRLGNLTIMAESDNTVIGNAEFALKKTEFANSSVGLTKRLAKFKAWNATNLKLREKELIQLAIAVFKI